MCHNRFTSLAAIFKRTLIVGFALLMALLPGLTRAWSNGQPATLVLGQPNFVSYQNNNTAWPFMMLAPNCVALDSSGTLWVADSHNNRVLRFDHAASKANGANADAVLGQPDFVSKDGTASQNGMSDPVGLVVDNSGTLWVADSGNNRVLRFDHAANKANGANADAVLGQPDFVSNGTATTQNGMNLPAEITMDSNGTLWIADQWNNRVLRFDNAASKANGANADAVLGQSDFVSGGHATTQIGMWYPSGVALDSSGTLWVTDSSNNRVLRFNNVASKVNGANADGVLGQPDFISRGDIPTQNEMYIPAGVTIDSNGTLWTTDYGDRVLRFDNATSKTNGANADAVLGQPDFVSYGPVSQYGMDSPDGVAVDPTTGKVFVADYNNNRVLRFAGVENLSSGSPAEAVLGQPDFSNTRWATTQNGMYNPVGVAVDSSGTLWVADQVNNRVLRFDHAANKANGANADGVLGQPNFGTSSLVTTQNGMADPSAVAVDSGGTLWVADLTNHRVLRFDNAASKTNGANADAVLGQTDFVSSSTATSQNGMSGPVGLAVDNSGNLWIADRFNDRVLRFDNAASKANGANADAVLGQTDFVSNGAATTQNRMYWPTGLAMDSSGTLWVADQRNNRVLRFANAASKANGANADAVLGQTDFVSSGFATTQSGMYWPSGLAVDNNGTLWVADQQNSRVLSFVSGRLDTIGIFRSGTFYLRLHNSTGFADISVAFTVSGKLYPIVGDWVGQGFDTVGVFNQNSGQFSLRNSNTPGTPDEQFVFGNPNDMPLSGKWLASATQTGVGVFRPSNGLIYLKNVLTTGYADYTMVLGIPGDVGLAGDWTGKGYESPGVYRPSNSNFYLSNQDCNCSVYADIQFSYGIGGDAPVAGDWIGQGHDGVGLFRQSNGYTYLRNTLTTGYADNAFTYGIAGDVPVAGHWQLTYPPKPNESAPINVLVPPTFAPTPAQGGLNDGLGD